MKRFEIDGLASGEPELHNGATVARPPRLVSALRAFLPRRARNMPIAVSAAAGRWNYALSLAMNEEHLRELPPADAVVVTCRVRVHEGRLGVVATARDHSTFVSHESTVLAGPGAKTLRIWLREPAESRHLVFRNVEPDGKPARFEVLDVFGHVLRGARNFVATWSNGSVDVIDGAELGRLVEWAAWTWDTPFVLPARNASVKAPIEIVDVEDLPSILGGNARVELPPDAKTKSLADWKMESDDAPILECLWRAKAPRRHLEFGTWEGFGAALVAGCTDAEIWTLNLPEGEVSSDGASLYASTDTGENIGWRYRAAGVAHRVHQLLCDSRDFDTKAFAADFFDTVLIDGGHTPDIVVNDTDKALRVLRPGGLCVWHDFCPDPDALSKNLAPLGVVQAIVENIDRWRPLFDRIYWIRKSWLLVGERAVH